MRTSPGVAIDEITAIGVLDYPGCMRSAVQGLHDLFGLANLLAPAHGVSRRYAISTLRTADCVRATMPLQVLIVPPNMDGDFYLAPDSATLDWLRRQHAQGCVLCSACAGSFVLAASGLLRGRRLTTHWMLATDFARRYPDCELDVDALLVDGGDVVTAGGVMAWIDLGLELVSRWSGPMLMRELGRLMVVDTGAREQRYYARFVPRFDHGDAVIVKAQHYLQANHTEPLRIAALARLCCLSERTLLRRFQRATGWGPNEYLQRLRIQHACSLLEATRDSIDEASQQAGYEDPSAFRRTFQRIVGLTPREFRSRFAQR